MSTTFDVYPGELHIPLFKDVFDLCTKEYHKYLFKVGIPYKPQIAARISTHEGNREIGFNMHGSFQWKADQYLWVQVKGIPGGTDGYFEINTPFDFEYRTEDIIPSDHCKPICELLRTCISIGHHWKFRRSVGQPGVIHILYGILAGTVAAMTRGVVFSDDSAWDYQRMPIRGSDFLENYYYPEKERNEEIKNNALQCIQWAKEELSSGTG